MRIAILSSIHWRTPPRKYGPWEWIASMIAEGMVKRGHDVTLYATGDSLTKGELRSICPRPVMEDSSLESKVYQYLHSALPFEEANNFDIIHNHYDAYPLCFSKLVKTPVVTTIHGFSSPQVPLVYRTYNNTSYVSISMADRNHAPDLNYVANIYHGIPVDDYKFCAQPESYFLYLGRIAYGKGVHVAVQMAKNAGVPLKIAGLMQDREYFDRTVKPFLSDNIEYLGEVNEEEKRNLIQKAKGFLHMNSEPEGFGLTLIEAMACGVPVVGMDSGSVSEVIDDGNTGFVVKTEDEAIEKIKIIDTINRKDCRKRVEDLFSVERMVGDYEKVYEKILRA